MGVIKNLQYLYPFRNYLSRTAKNDLTYQIKLPEPVTRQEDFDMIARVGPDIQPV